MAGTKRRTGRKASSKAPPTAVRDRPGAVTIQHGEQPAPSRRAVGLGAIVLGVLACALYVPAVAHDFIVGDSTEFVAVSATLGVAHPPGYPVLVMLGHLASLLPMAELPFRVNLLSAVLSAVTVALVFVTAVRLTRSLSSAAVAAAALATNELYLRWSLVAEAFPLNDLLAAAVVLCLVLWHERPQRSHYLVLGAFCGGLGLANHQTIVLLGGGILFLIVDRRRAFLRRPGTIVACVAAVVLGLLPYAYLPWAASHDPAFNWGSIASFNDLVAHFVRASYGTSELVPEAANRGGSPTQRVVALAASFGPVLGVLVLLGAIEAYRRRRWYFWFATLAFGIAGPAFVVYSNVNLSLQGSLFVLQRFFLLSLVLVAPLAAFGLEFLVRTLVQHVVAVPRLSRQAVALVVLSAMLVTTIGAYPRVDVSADQVARHYGEDLLASLPQNAVVLAKGDQVVLPVAYLQEVELVRPDVTLVILGLFGADWYVSQLRERHHDLNIPFAHYDKRSATLKALVDANPMRSFVVLDEPLPDDSLAAGYWFYSHGLAQEVLPVTVDRDLPQLVSENEQLLGTYRIPKLSDVKTDSFERSLLSQYALVAYRVGQQEESLQRTDDARTWYQRALAIDPMLASALDAMRRLGPQQ